MFQMSLLREEDVEPLAEGVMTVLDKVGMLYQNEEMLSALEKLGARVDYKSQRATFPKELVRDFVESVRKEVSQKDDTPKNFTPPPLPCLQLQVAQFFYDYKNGEKRRGNREDFLTLVKLGDVLHPEEGVGHCLILTDVPPLLEPLFAGLLLTEYAHKPAGVYYTDVRQIDYLLEMDDILGGEGSLYPRSAICFAHPLRFDKPVADRFVWVVKNLNDGWLTPMPVAGVTTPVTVEGFIVTASAEILGGWLVARALNPKARLGSSMWAGTPDMRGGVSYSSFDAMFYGFAVAEFMRRWCCKNLPVGGGEYCDAKKPGLYAVLEKAYKAMTIAAFQGYHPPIGQGMLECGKTICPEQIILEREFGLGIKHFAREITPTSENIALDSIIEVDLGIKMSHLETVHTLRNFRSCLWLPSIVDRSGWNGFVGEAKIMENAHREVEKLLSQYNKPEGRKEKIAQIREVIEKAEKKLLE